MINRLSTAPFEQNESWGMRCKSVRCKARFLHSNVAASYNIMGAVYQGQCRYKETLEMHSKALEIRIHLIGDHLDIAASYHNMGTVYESQGRYDEAPTAPTANPWARSQQPP